jgi:stage V sporulation protein R
MRPREREAERDESRHPPRETPYDDLFALDREEPDAEEALPIRHSPPEPEKDLLLFIAQHARDLEEWQRDVVQIVRNEQLYFVPQMQTKILNEGWAAYWHREIMHELDLSTDEAVEFANLNAAVLAPSQHQMNPYYVGLKIFESIKRRWDDPTEADLREPGRGKDRGLEKMFEVREMDSDVSFLRNYLTRDLVEELDLYLYKREGDQWVVVEKDWTKIRDMLVATMTNFGVPYIVVEDGDYRRNGELYLKHYYEGQELDVKYAEKTLQAIYSLWRRPVHVETVVDEKPTLMTFDGSRNTQAQL